MNTTAKYLIAQHIADLFRSEPRNVGVIVLKGGDVGARFVGETEPNVLDGRKLRGFRYPDVYRQWVDYWRGMLTSDADISPDVLTGSHYRVIEAGEVGDTGEDRAAEIANYLYALLVSEGGLAEALGIEEEPEAAAARLRDEISDELARVNILASHDAQLELVPHPVRRDVEVRGTTAEPHRPSFVQENGKLYVVESVDFTTRQKDRAKDHAGWAAYMFDDIREKRGDTYAISIVRLRPEDEADYPSVRYGLSLLSNESDEVLNWMEPADQRRFVEERRLLALQP